MEMNDLGMKSNFFRVKNKKDFRDFLHRFNLILIEKQIHGISAYAFGNHLNNNEGVGIPFYVNNEQNGKLENADFLKQLQQHLEPESLVIIVEFGLSFGQPYLNAVTVTSQEIKNDNLLAGVLQNQRENNPGFEILDFK